MLLPYVFIVSGVASDVVSLKVKIFVIGEYLACCVLWVRMNKKNVKTLFLIKKITVVLFKKCLTCFNVCIKSCTFIRFIPFSQGAWFAKRQIL